MKRFLSILFFAIPFTLLAQEEENKSTFQEFKDNLSGSFESNAQWYNDDEKLGDFSEAIKDPLGDDHLRANSYLRLDYNFLKNFTVGVQVESYAPMSLMNYSPNFDKEIGLAQYYANFKNDKLDITAGYFYEQYGSGVLLRAWEDRALGLNTSLRGGRLQYNINDNIMVSGFWGQQRVGFDVSDSNLFGANAELDLAGLFKMEKLNAFDFGISYLGKKEDFTTTIPNSKVPKQVNSYSLRTNIDFGKFYTNFEYVKKGKDARLNDTQLVAEEETFEGSAYLWTLGYSKKGFGISNTFRRLEGMNFYAERLAGTADNLYNEQIIGYLPGLTKQHDYTLTNIYVYQSQPGLSMVIDNVNSGEIGTQLDVYYNIKKGTALGGKYGIKLAANFSYWASLNNTVTDPNFDPSSTINILSDATTYESDFLNFENKLFRDMNIEVRKKWSPKLSSIFSYVNVVMDSDLLKGSPSGLTNKYVNSNIFVAESTLKLGKGRSTRLELQHLSNKKAKSSNNYDEDMGNWVGGTLEFNLNKHFGIYLNDSYNYGNDDEDQQNHYYNVGGSYTKGATRVALNYGRQRGGLLCVGGVCRIVSPNTGLTLNLTTSF